MENDYSLLRDPDMKEIFDSFCVETVEILDKLDVDLMELEKRPEDADLLNDIFRSFHTIKGTSGFLGLEKLQTVTHRCEDILNKLRKGEAILKDHIMDAILEAYDTLKILMDVIETKLNEDYDTGAVITKLDVIIGELNNDPVVQPPDDPPESEKTEAESTSEEIRAVDPETQGVDIPTEVANKPTVEKPSAAPKDSASKIKDHPAMKKGDNSIRVDVERLDALLNIVSELVLGRNRLTQLHIEASSQFEGTKFSRDLSETSRQIDLMTTELQLAVMKTRMIKIGKVFNKYPRLVRDLSKETQKSIRLEIFGEETELDKTLIEEINDPLVHLIRNSIDHGIETPDVRKKQGKEETGTITLSAEHEGNNIIISIEDDGKGIDTDILKQKAIEKGLMTEERTKELSKQEAFNIIFMPGFSTAQNVTNISGRGVGMDVVKTNVTKLRGIINIESEIGKGTKIIIKLPLTLAIIQGLLVSIVKQTLVIPLSSVIEVVRVEKNQIYHVNRKEVIKLRDTVLPLIDIDNLLYSVDSTHDDEAQYVVIVGVAEKKFGIKVDELIGQREVVIKSLGGYLGNIEGIAGSTIMGDGTVVMILDLSELVANIHND